MRYTEIAPARPFSGSPKINIPTCIGASPKKPILIKIAATGKRPIKYSAEGLPVGLKLRENIISGCVASEGEYKITLLAENEFGRCKKEMILEIKKDTLLLTPLMGFTSWNAFGFEVSADMLLDTAKRMDELGISEYGYSYINIDSGWQGEYGGKYDAIMPNEKFPDMKDFCDQLHARGYKCGIYSTPMLHAFGCSIDHIPLPPGCTVGEPDDRFADERGGIGLIRKEKNNALQWAEWGFDYLKYDWRPSDPFNAELMRKELIATDRDFGFCVTVKARPEYHTYWKKYCNSYRCNVDSVGTWKNLINIYRTYFDFIEYVNKGHYFDLDMLDIGKCELFFKLGFTEAEDFGLTEDETVIAYSIRAFLNSPIQISANLDEISDFEMSVYCNEEIIAINQDCNFDTAKPYLIIEGEGRMLHIFKKELEGGNVAYAIFNLGEKEETAKIYLREKSNVRDVWAKKDMNPTSTISVIMPRHTARIFKVSKIN